MTHVSVRSLGSIFGIATGVVVFDWWTKSWAINQGWVVGFNQGISFGLLPHLSDWWPVFSVLALGCLVWWGWSTWRLSPVAVGLVIGGGVANVLDRVFRGGVHDWLPVPFFDLYNNVADWAVFIALLWFFWQKFETGNRVKEQKK